MNRSTVLLLVFFLFTGSDIWSAGREEAAPAIRPAPAARPQAARPPTVINMNRGTSGGHNRNFPSSSPKPTANRPRTRLPTAK